NFRHVAPEQIPYAANRYQREAKRHYEVLDTHLTDLTYLVVEEFRKKNK
ncbi:unnamed protein product, partial [Ectocarpus fasciculatus]